MTHEQTVWNSVIAAWRGDMNAKIAQLSAAVAQIGGEPVRIVKEEKKMLNVEKYLTTIKEEIAKDACASKSCLIAKVRGDERPDCNDRTCRDCSDESLDWLFSEHEPPLLKNGDGLKPGDWIMVRDRESDEWRKKQFVFCHNGWFYCLLEGNNFAQINLPTIRYEQARLPEKGE